MSMHQHATALPHLLRRPPCCLVAELHQVAAAETFRLPAAQHSTAAEGYDFAAVLAWLCLRPAQEPGIVLLLEVIGSQQHSTSTTNSILTVQANPRLVR